MIRNFLILTTLFALCNRSFASSTSSCSDENSLECNLPAPSNFHVVNIGPSYVDLAWDSVPDASGYFLQTFDTLGNLVSTDTITNTSATVSGLQPGVPYYSLLSTMCEQEGFGIGQPPAVARVDYIILIVELIVQASGPPSSEILFYSPNCSSLPWSGIGTHHWFEIKEYGTNRIAQYKVTHIIEGLENATVQVGRVIPSSLETVHENTAGTPPVTTSYVSINIRLKNGPVIYMVSFIGYPNSPVLEICGTPVDDAIGRYTFSLIENIWDDPEGHGGGDRDDNNNSKQIQNNSPFVSIKNPFAETIDFISMPSEEPVSIGVFNLNGNLVLEKHFETRQEQYSFPTEFLPAGFYFLRMETAGKVKTFKIVKSE